MKAHEAHTLNRVGSCGRITNHARKVGVIQLVIVLLVIGGDVSALSAAPEIVAGGSRTNETRTPQRLSKTHIIPALKNTYYYAKYQVKALTTCVEVDEFVVTEQVFHDAVGYIHSGAIHNSCHDINQFVEIDRVYRN